MLRRSTAAARRSDSTNSACAAPRDSASSPSAPEPAHRSSTLAPASPGSCSSAANSASRTRSDVGRVPVGGTASRRPPATPAMTRTTRTWSAEPCSTHGHPLTSSSSRSPPSTCCTEPMASRATVPAVVRGDRRLHLHRLDGGHGLPGLDLLALGHLQRHHAGERRGDVVRVGPVGLLRGLDVGRDRRVAHRHRAQLPVQRGQHVAVAALVGLGDRLQLDQQRDPRLQLDGVLDLGLQPVEEVLRGQHDGVAVGLAGAPRTPWPGRGTAAGSAWPGGRRAARAVLDRTARRAAFSGGATGQRPGAERLRPAARAGRPARRAGSRSPSRARRSRPGRPRSPSASTPAPTRCSARSPDHLGRRGDLHQPAEHPVGRGVAVLDQLEAVGQAQRDRLLAQVGQLPAGDLVVVDPPGRRRPARTRTARTPCAPPPSTAPGRRPPAARARWPGRCGRSRRPAPTATAGWSCRPCWPPPRRPRPPRRRWPRSGWPAGRRRCRGCAGAPAGRTGSRSALTSVRAAGGRSSPAMSLMASTCAPAATISSASFR